MSAIRSIASSCSESFQNFGSALEKLAKKVYRAVLAFLNSYGFCFRETKILGQTHVVILRTDPGTMAYAKAASEKRGHGGRIACSFHFGVDPEDSLDAIEEAGFSTHGSTSLDESMRGKEMYYVPKIEFKDLGAL